MDFWSWFTFILSFSLIKNEILYLLYLLKIVKTRDSNGWESELI